MKPSDYTNPRIYQYYQDKAVNALAGGLEISYKTVGLVQMPYKVCKYLDTYCWCGTP